MKVKEDIKTTRKALGDTVSESQRILDEILNPEIEESKRHAIKQSPKIRERDFCTNYEIFPRAVIQFKRGADKRESMKRLIEAYTKKPYGEVMKPIKTK